MFPSISPWSLPPCPSLFPLTRYAATRPGQTPPHREKDGALLRLVGPLFLLPYSPCSLSSLLSPFPSTRYAATPPGQTPPYREKDGALLVVGALNEKLKSTSRYAGQLETMLTQHVFPEFNSPMGHLRAKVGTPRDSKKDHSCYVLQKTVLLCAAVLLLCSAATAVLRDA